MAIDEPVSALQSLNASDERQQSPVMRYAKPFLDIARLLAPLGTTLPLDSVRAAVDWLAQRDEKNCQELVEVIAEEVKQQGEKIQRLLTASEQHRQFMADEMPRLVADALRRAEQCRASERIARLATILTHAVEFGPHDGADMVEEMMTLATALSAIDVAVLQGATREYKRARTENAGYQQTWVAARAWERAMSRLKLSPDEQTSVGAKLESFGLMIKLEREAWEPPAFRPLERADKFIEYIRTAAGKT